MPNWCSNRIEASPKVLEKVYTLDESGDGIVDFNLAVPMPAHQPNIDAPDFFIAEGGIGTDVDPRNWYNWSIENWGTKWNTNEAYEVEGGVDFDTAWSPPLAWFSKLCELFPDEDIKMQSYEPGMGISCGAYNEHGTMVVEDIPDTNNELRPEDEEDYDDE